MYVVFLSWFFFCPRWSLFSLSQFFNLLLMCISLLHIYAQYMYVCTSLSLSSYTYMGRSRSCALRMSMTNFVWPAVVQAQEEKWINKREQRQPKKPLVDLCMVQPDALGASWFPPSYLRWRAKSLREMCFSTSSFCHQSTFFYGHQCSRQTKDCISSSDRDSSVTSTLCKRDNSS